MGTRQDDERVKIEARRIKEEYAYMDDMPLDGWFWEIIRRTAEYQTLCTEIRSIDGPISRKEADTIDGRLRSIGIDNQYYFERDELWIPLPTRLFPEEYEQIHDIDAEEVRRLDTMIRDLEVIPPPELSYHDICQYFKKRFGTNIPFLPLVNGMSPSCEVIDVEFIYNFLKSTKDLFYEKTKPQLGVGMLYTDESYTDRLLKSIVSLFIRDESTLLVRIDKNASIKDAEQVLAPLLRRHLKTRGTKKRINDKWKSYIIVYDLKRQHPDWGYSDIADVMNEAFPPEKDFLALDARTIQNHHKQALLLINGEYKKYLYL